MYTYYVRTENQFYHFAEKKLNDKYSKLLLFIFVFLNGGILMWTNSVRWYAYWVPLFIILYTFLLKKINKINKFILCINTNLIIDLK